MSNSLDLPRFPPRGRRLYCTRTTNLGALEAIGYDMDYTLIHYRIEEWERLAYEYSRRLLAREGWPVDQLSFDPELMIRGLVIDTELGNVVKANRFGYVKRALHGSLPLPFDSQRAIYSRLMVDVTQKRFAFLNTFFGMSEGCLYAQLVDLLDAGELPGVLGYRELYRKVRRTIDRVHAEGQLKDEVRANPERFVALDPEAPLALLDQRKAGKKLLLITNSGWVYTQSMMTYAFDRYLPDQMSWRDLFDVVIVAAGKPSFFSQRTPLYEVVGGPDEELLRPNVGDLRGDAVYHGGNAGLVEAHLGLTGEQILYVGDHILADVMATKSVLRWRTALVVRELEGELAALEGYAERQEQLSEMMRHKEQMEFRTNQLRLLIQRKRNHYGPPVEASEGALYGELKRIRNELSQLDSQIAPLARSAGELSNPHWGLIMRTGSDKSLMAHHVERDADLYTSRPSNFGYHTPFAYIRSTRGSLPHDPSGPAPSDQSDHSRL